MRVRAERAGWRVIINGGDFVLVRCLRGARAAEIENRPYLKARQVLDRSYIPKHE